MIPLSAAGADRMLHRLGALDSSFAIDYIYPRQGGWITSLGKVLWMSNPDIYLPEYTAATPLNITYSNIQPIFNEGVEWSYLSFELATFEDNSHYSVGFFSSLQPSGEVIQGYRFVYYDATNGDSVEFFAHYTPAYDGVTIKLEYWTEIVNDVEKTYCKVFVDHSNNVWDYSYTFAIEQDTPFQVIVKTYFASGTYDVSFEDPEEKYGYDSGFSDGYSEGHLDGHEAGFNVGVSRGEQNVLDNIKNYLTEKNVLLDTGTSFEALMSKVEDLGWTRCIDQGLITQKLMITLIDAPVNMVLASLNFDMFGFNVSSVVLTIFSIAVSYVLIAAVLKILPLV